MRKKLLKAEEDLAKT